MDESPFSKPSPDAKARPGLIDKLTGHAAKLTLLVAALVGLMTAALSGIPRVAQEWEKAHCSFFDCSAVVDTKRPGPEPTDTAEAASPTSGSSIKPATQTASSDLPDATAEPITPATQSPQTLPELVAAIDDNDGDSQQKAKYQLQARHLVADQFSFGTLNIRFASSVERWTGRIGFISYEPETNVLKLEQTKKIEENYTGSWTFEYEWVATVKIDLDGVRHLYYDEAQGENFWIKCGGGRNACIQYFVTVEDCSGKCRTPSDGIMEFRFIDDASRARALRDTFSYLIYDIGQAERAPR